MRDLGLYMGLFPPGGGFSASFSANVAHDATAGVIGAINFSDNEGAVSIVGGATSGEAGNNGGLFSVDVSLNVTFDVDAISLSPGQSVTTTDTITLTDGTTQIPVNLNVTVTNSDIPDTAVYVYPNSLWVNGSTDHVAYWLGQMEETDSTDIFYDGEATAFFANGGGYPSADPLNLVQGASGMRSHNSSNPGDDYTDVVFTANNFVQSSTVSTEYTNHRDRMSTLISHWRSTLGQDPIFWIQEDVPEGVMLTDPIGSATRDELDDMLDILRSGTHPDWFDTLLAAVEALQPAADIRLYKAGFYFQNVVQGTALIDLDPDDFFVDTDPHGTDLHYALKAMVFYAYTEGYVPTSSSWTTGLPSTFTSNYTAIAARIEDLVLGNAVTPQALSSNDWSVVTSSTASGLDFDIDFIPEAVTRIDYSTDDGSTWADIGGTTDGVYTITTASGGGTLAGNTSFTTRLRLVNATGNGQGSRSKAGTSAAAAGLSMSMDTGAVEATGNDSTMSVAVNPSMSMDTGAMEVSGNDSPMSASGSYNMTMDTQGIEVTGNDSTMSATGNYSMTMDVQGIEVTGNDSTMATGGGSINYVTFDGTNDYIDGTDAGSSETTLTVAMQVDFNTWNTNDALMSGWGTDSALFCQSGGNTIAYVGEDTGFVGGNSLPGTIGTTIYSILITIHQTGGLASSNSVRIQVNGSDLLTSTSTGSGAIDMSFLTFFNGDGLFDGDVSFLWAGHTANEDYSDFFDGSDEPLTAFATSSTVDTVDPFLFFYDNTATEWNSGTDDDGNSYTMNGSVVDA